MKIKQHIARFTQASSKLDLNGLFDLIRTSSNRICAKNSSPSIRHRLDTKHILGEGKAVGSLRYVKTLLILISACLSVSINAGEREQAKRIHDRIAGVPPTASVLDTMADDIANGRAEDAAFRAMDHDAFYNVTLKNLAAPWTNEAMSVFVPLNDYIATIIGIVRDDVDFRTALYSDLIYIADPALGLGTPSASNNTHYESLETQGHDLQDALIATTQSSVYGLPVNATAGVMTSRASARAFMIDGTNRAAFRFTVLNHLCNDMEQLNDTSLPPDRIRQDVSRSPGGDSKIFLNNCIGCHNGMDPMTQSFAYYDWEYNSDTDPSGDSGRMVYNTEGTVDPDTGSRVQGKNLINSNNFKFGFVTTNDRWDNYWRSGQNSLLNWDESLPGGGNGAKSMGMELAHSQAFAQCQVKKVFESVCLREPSDAADRTKVSEIVTNFQNSGYRLKQVFADTAVYCMGE